MKTAEEFVKEITCSKELVDEMNSIKDVDALEAFLKKYDCGAAPEEFKAAVDAVSEGAMSDDEAQAAAGGLTLLLPRLDITHINLSDR